LRLFCFCQYSPLVYSRRLIFSFTPFGWPPPVNAIPYLFHYVLWEYHFWFTHFFNLRTAFSWTLLGGKTGTWLKCRTSCRNIPFVWNSVLCCSDYKISLHPSFWYGLKIHCTCGRYSDQVASFTTEDLFQSRQGHEIFLFLGASPKLREATCGFVMSVRPSAWNNSVPTGWIFTKFDIWLLFENIDKKNQVFISYL